MNFRTSALARMDGAIAESIATRALTFVADDPELFSRFLQVTGVDAGDIRVAAGQPGFLAGVLDFVLDHEPTLLRFASAVELTPEAVVAARRALDGSYGSTPE